MPVERFSLHFLVEDSRFRRKRPPEHKSPLRMVSLIFRFSASPFPLRRAAYVTAPLSCPSPADSNWVPLRRLLSEWKKYLDSEKALTN